MPYSEHDKSFLRCLRNGLRWAAEHPHGRIKLDWCTSIPASEIRIYVRARIQLAISARGDLLVSRGRRDTYDYQARLRRDQKAIRDYRMHRIRRSGSGLETAEGRHIAPDVHDAFRERF